ncbi:DUF2958 domain-containing protein [Acuticoccus sediminis]|uniref:DUF2958 domain-containing protein n=1 Tax=Acuticoccus sediminis TaxID=2184697 RepID=UPI001CFEA006|nr:DUF2958 domain-containing protein [Acuticoccus sediminis]
MSAPLLTKAQREQLLANGRPSLATIDHDPFPVVKLFSPYMNGTWLLTELDPEEQDIAFGLCDLGVGFPELGCVRVSELAGLRLGAVPAIERDRHWQATAPLSAYVDAAYAAGHIVDTLPVTAEEGAR